MKTNQHGYHAPHHRNLRFWVWVMDGGWVKVTLKPGQTLRWHAGGPDEEGHWWRYETWEHAGDEVIRKSGHGGKDCDGVTAQHWVDSCRLDALHTVASNDDPEVFRPDWQQQDTSVYDQYAQLSNY